MNYESEENKLIVRAKNRDKEALRCLIENNFKYIKIEAYKITYTSSVINYEDLISEGILGLIKAVDKFDIDKNIKFITYAIWWIREAILAYVNSNFWRIKVSKRLKPKLSQIERDKLNNMVFIDDINVNASTVVYEETGYEKVENKIFYTQLYTSIEKLLNGLELEIFRAYYGIGCNSMTLEEIGRKYSVSGERVRQIKKKALDKIRNKAGIIRI